jgi:hypothetical protein
MYVAFQGTKQVRDWAANLSFRHATMWHGGKGEVRARRWLGAGEGRGGGRALRDRLR